MAEKKAKESVDTAEEDAFLEKMNAATTLQRMYQVAKDRLSKMAEEKAKAKEDEVFEKMKAMIR